MQVDSPDRNVSSFFMRVLSSYGVGMTWANDDVKVSGGKALFCIPNKLAITEEQTADILRRAIKENAYIGDLPAGLALLTAYKNTFPCN